MSTTDGPPPVRSRLVGILGGMGPAATVDFYRQLVAHTPAELDQDHVRVVMWADPSVPSRQEAILSGAEDPSPWLQEGIDHLVACGAEILVVPCNTVHHFLAPLVPDGIEFLSIVDCAVDAVAGHPTHDAVGLAATDAALATGLFQAALTRAGSTVVLPDEAGQGVLRAVVAQVKSGRADETTHSRLVEILTDLRHRGAGVSVAGCTELSALLGRYDAPESLTLVDPALELALATVRRAAHASAVSA